jgi:hypothetical protein
VTIGRAEPLLSFGHRALVHFAVSNDLAAMTTRLEGEKTHFLPFNIGYDHGAGNPPGEDGRSATAYLWERVWVARGRNRPPRRACPDASLTFPGGRRNRPPGSRQPGITPELAQDHGLRFVPSR